MVTNIYVLSCMWSQAADTRCVCSAAGILAVSMVGPGWFAAFMFGQSFVAAFVLHCLAIILPNSMSFADTLAGMVSLACTHACSWHLDFSVVVIGCALNLLFMHRPHHLGLMMM